MRVSINIIYYMEYMYVCILFHFCLHQWQKIVKKNIANVNRSFSSYVQCSLFNVPTPELSIIIIMIIYTECVSACIFVCEYMSTRGLLVRPKPMFVNEI